MVTVQDWLNAGEKLFHEQGNKGISIARLCDELSVTKGSFYHHFKTMSDYRATLEAHMNKKGNAVSTRKETSDEKKEAWFLTALRILKSQGYQHVTLDQLYTDMGVSKGAFYYLFKNRDVFIKELLRYWEKETLENILTTVQHDEADFQTVDDIISLSQQLTNRRAIDVQIRAWARVDKNVLQYQKKLDQHQLDACKNIIRQLFDLDEDKVSALANTAYLSFIGSQHIIPEVSEEEWADSLKVLIPLVHSL